MRAYTPEIGTQRTFIGFQANVFSGIVHRIGAQSRRLTSTGTWSGAFGDADRQVFERKGEGNMSSVLKAVCASVLATSLGLISAQAFAQAAPIEFRVVAGDRNPASCQQFDAALSRVHTLTPAGDTATLRTAGGVTSNMTQSSPNVFTTRLGIGGTNFDVVADASKSPKTLEVREPRIGCRWSAVAP